MLFATHYHPLTTEFAGDDRIKLGYMTAAVSPQSQPEDRPCITFLYKLQAGTSPQSYGLQVGSFLASCKLLCNWELHVILGMLPIFEGNA